MNEDDSSKHVSSTFRGVYKRKFDTKWRAEITAGATIFADYSLLLSKVNDAYRAKTMVAAFCCMHLSTGQMQIDVIGPMSNLLSATQHTCCCHCKGIPLICLCAQSYRTQKALPGKFCQRKGGSRSL